MTFDIFKCFYPILFASFIFSTSDFSTNPHENDIEWETWDSVGSEPHFRQSDLVNQSCRCGRGVSRLNVTTKIVGGVTSKNHSWPWAAAIVNMNVTPHRAYCGASLIASQYLLTAAHCLIGMKKVGLKNFRIYLGGNRINGNNITDRIIMHIGAVKIHPAYNNVNLSNDIGLIRMASPVKYTTNINPVCLSQNGTPFVGVESIVEGWGDVKFGANNGSNSLREVHLKIISNAQCRQTYPGLLPTTICGENPKKDFCNGDSGSSQVILRSQNTTTEIFTQVGIVSFNKECSATPAVSTRVKNYISFIKFNLRSVEFCSDTFG